MKILCIAFFLIGLMFPRADAGDVADDKKAIQGTWSIIYAFAEGKRLPAEEIKEVEIVILADKLTLGKANGREWQYRLDSSKKPKAINLVIETSKLSKDGNSVIVAKEKLAGIYELKDDELRIAWSKGIPLKKDAKDQLEADKSAVRPSSFEHGPDVEGVLMFKRVRK